MCKGWKNPKSQFYWIFWAGILLRPPGLTLSWLFNGNTIYEGISRPSKCPKPYTTMISGQKEVTPKRAQILSKFKLQQMGVISKLNTKIHNFNKIPYKYFVNTQLKL